MVWIISRESHLSPLSGCHFDWKKTLDFLQSRYPGLAAVPWSPRFKGRRSRKKIPCSALMAFFEFSHSGSEENLTKHPIRKAWQSYNAFGLCEYLGALKCKMLRFNEISWVHLAFLHVFSFPFLGAFTGQRLMSLRSNLAAWLKPPHGPLLSAPHLDEITMKWFSWNEMTISLNLRSNLQRLKARHWGLTYLLKWRDPLEQWALGWSGRGQRLCRKWIASTHINTFSILWYFLSSFVSALRLEWI